MKPQMLVYHMPEEKVAEIRTTVLPMGIRVRIVTEEDVSQTLESLALDEKFEEKPCKVEGNHEVLAMCGFSQLQFSLVMGLFQRKKLPAVPVKAMMTDTNKNWPFAKLVAEVWEEHQKMHQKKS